MDSLLRAKLALCWLTISLAACGSGRAVGTAESGSRVSNEEKALANESIEHMLERKAPGLVVVPTPEGVVLQIRGNSSIVGAVNPPLYILNDLPFQPGPNGLVSGISINDIVSVKVLRGGQAALYGIDGANGVIVISTRQAGRQDP